MKTIQENNTKKVIWATSISETWKAFYDDGDFFDLTLACEDKQIHCHKAIISSTSPILKNILKQNLNEKALIILNGIKYDNLRNLVTFMYKGEVNVCEKDLGRFLTIAQELKIKGMAEESEKVGFLKVNLSKKNIESSAEVASEDFRDKPHESNITNKQKVIDDLNTSNNPNFNDDSDIFTKNDIANHNSNSNLNETLKIEELKENEKQNTVGSDKSSIVKDINDQFRSDYENSGKSILLSYISELSTLANAKENSEIFNEGLETLVDRNKKDLDSFIGKNKKIYICKICDKQWASQSGLQRHVKSFHEGIIYACEICPKQFKDTSGYYAHKSSVHNGVTHSCNQCEATFVKKNNLNIHIASKHEGKRYPCKLCIFIGINPRSLRDHLQIIHQGIRKQCDKCDFQAKTGVLLTLHVDSVHLGIRYPCKECNYVAVDKHKIKAHIKNCHSGLFFPCNQCEYEAKHRNSLVTHLKTKHKN